ncbi:glycosyltransferase [Shewanella sp. 10N.261.52.F9]|uniref:glycosyltransferase n=1 Tax=Shewanella sp. 10N.261.52.F9 TaxID=3229684 RepID=UPI003550D9C9
MKACIVTLIYNNYNSLIKTVNSVLEQDFDYQYIIYDDGSSVLDDSVISELFDLIVNRKNVTYIRKEENQGTVKAFNFCLLKTSCELIIPLSSGDVFYDHTSVKEIAFAFNKGNVNLVTYDCLVYDEEPSKEIGSLLPKKKDRALLQLSSECILAHILQYGNFISGARTSYRRSFIENLGYFDEDFRLLEDLPFYLKSLSKGTKIYHLSKVIIYYKTGGVSTSGINPMLQKDYYKILSKLESGTYGSSGNLESSYRAWLMFHFGSKFQCFIVYPQKTIKLIYKKIIGKICLS